MKFEAIKKLLIVPDASDGFEIVALATNKAYGIRDRDIIEICR